MVGRARLLGDDVGAERDRAAERPVLDLELLVDAALDVGLAAVAGERQLAALDLEPEVAGVDAGELGVDDRARRLVGVEDVDRGREARCGATSARRCRRRRRRARPSRGACARSWRTGRAPGHRERRLPRRGGRPARQTVVDGARRGRSRPGPSYGAPRPRRAPARGRARRRCASARAARAPQRGRRARRPRPAVRWPRAVAGLGRRQRRLEHRAGRRLRRTRELVGRRRGRRRRRSARRRAADVTSIAFVGM